MTSIRIESNTKKDIGVAILAGGRSLRMGEPKAELMLCEDGRKETFLEHMCAQFAMYKHRFISINDTQEYCYPGYEQVIDEYAGIGPLGGIVSVLRRAGTSAVLFIGCDMPLFTSAAAEYLIDNWDGSPICYSVVDGCRQPLAAIYTEDCIQSIEKQIMRGDYKLGLLIDSMDSQVVDMSGFAECYLNINTAEDYRKL